MMDGRVAAIRAALDAAGLAETADPLVRREVRVGVLRAVPRGRGLGARSSATAAATRWTRPTRARRCARCALDVEEGADIVMVKPALPYLDVIRARARDASTCRSRAYNVSGEYAMVKAAAAKGWIDEERDRARVAHLRSPRGADFILTYFAREVPRARGAEAA